MLKPVPFLHGIYYKKLRRISAGKNYLYFSPSIFLPAFPENKLPNRSCKNPLPSGFANHIKYLKLSALMIFFLAQYCDVSIPLKSGCSTFPQKSPFGEAVGK
jgi:hypothetical protein